MIGVRYERHPTATATRPGAEPAKPQRKQYDERHRDQCLACPFAECKRGVCPLVRRR